MNSENGNSQERAELEILCQKSGNYNEKEGRKSFPTQLTCDSRDRSDLIRLYLSHNNFNREIEDLETRERQASLKHLWEETLRFRNMRNRLELSRERQIYQRNDLQIDPETKKEALKHLEIRSKQLEEREKKCADSGMYSEDAKKIWNQWVEEDRKSSINNFNDLKHSLLKQLEEEWLRLSEKDKKTISQIDVTDSSMPYEMQLLAKKGMH